MSLLGLNGYLVNVSNNHFVFITNDLDSNMEIEYKMNQTQVSQILELNKN